MQFTTTVKEKGILELGKDNIEFKFKRVPAVGCVRFELVRVGGLPALPDTHSYYTAAVKTIRPGGGGWMSVGLFLKKYGAELSVDYPNKPVYGHEYYGAVSVPTVDIHLPGKTEEEIDAFIIEDLRVTLEVGKAYIAIVEEE